MCALCRNIPNYWKWYADIDFLHYAWGALMQNQFKPHPTELFNGQPVLEYYYLHGARGRFKDIGRFQDGKRQMS
jgi:hypothetical protein